MKIKRKNKLPPDFNGNREVRILVCGSRDWTDEDTVAKELKRLIDELSPSIDIRNLCVITGSVKEDDNGVDSIVEDLCRNFLAIPCMVFRAPWKGWGRMHGNVRAAGPVRNGWMLRWGRPTHVLAFHPYLPASKGTKNMVEQARKEDIPVRIIDKQQKGK